MSERSALISCRSCGHSVLILLNHSFICTNCGATVRSADRARDGTCQGSSEGMFYGIVILRGPMREEQLILTSGPGQPVAFATANEAEVAVARLRGTMFDVNHEVDVVAVPLPTESEPSWPELLWRDPMVRAYQARAEVRCLAQQTRTMVASSRALISSSDVRSSHEGQSPMQDVAPMRRRGASPSPSLMRSGA